MFQFGGFASAMKRMPRLQRGGLPHSDVRGSQADSASPRLFAAVRVLLRLREPRHPPCALRYLSRTAPFRGSRLTAPRNGFASSCSHRNSFFSLSFARDPSRRPQGPRSVSFLSCLPPACQRTSGLRARKLVPLPLRTVENKGVEPLTPSLQSWCSSQLS